MIGQGAQYESSREREREREIMLFIGKKPNGRSKMISSLLLRTQVSGDDRVQGCDSILVTRDRRDSN